MRIVFNLRDQDWQTTKSLGILHVSTRILRGLAELPGIERLDVLANRSLRPLLPHPETSKIHLHYAAEPAVRGWQRLGWDHWAVVNACNRLAPDWLLLPKGFSPLLRWPRCRVSAYVHDNIFGHYRRQGLRPFPRGQATLFHRMLRQTARRADVVVTNSAHTATEFNADFFPRRPAVRIGAPVECSSSPPAPPAKPMLLVPTSTWPHKLTEQGIAWLQRWMRAHDFAGEVHGFGTLPPGVSWPAEPRWIHHGRIDDAALSALERRASALIYFSEYEGYGLPPIETLAAGRRAIASDLPALRETIPATALFDNASYDSFDRALTRALEAPPISPLLVETPREVAARWVAALRGTPTATKT
jgi:hypothetical protein